MVKLENLAEEYIDFQAPGLLTAVKGEFRKLKKQLGISDDFPENELEEIGKTKDWILGTYENMIKYGLTSVLKRPLETIKHVMNFSKDIFKTPGNKWDTNAPRYRILLERPPNEQYNNAAASAAADATATPDATTDVTGKPIPGMDKKQLVSGIKKFFKTPAAKPSDEEKTEMYKWKSGENFKAMYQQALAEQKPLAERMRMQWARNNPWMRQTPYSQSPPYYGGGGGKKGKSQSDNEMDELLDIMVDHKLWLMSAVEKAKKDLLMNKKERTIVKSGKKTRKVKKSGKGNKRGKGTKRRKGTKRGKGN